MKTSTKKSDKQATDPFDKLIYEKGIRAKNVIVDKSLDLLLLVLNNGEVIKSRLSDFPRLRKANNNDLKNWKLVGGGVAIEWENINEDLSIKGLIKTSALNDALRHLQGEGKELVHTA